MERIRSTINLLNFGLVILLVFSLVFSANISIPDSLIILGRMHPMILHLPIGIFFICILFIPLRKYIDPDNAVILQRILLELSAFFAMITAQLGLFLAQEDGYSSELLSTHKTAAIIFALGLFLLATFYNHINKKLELVIMAGLAITLIIAGHNGAVITHGENFLFPKTKELVLFNPDKSAVYDWAIKPILKNKCLNCHNPEKFKGDLILTDSTHLMLGGENGAVVNVGNSDESKLIQFIHLPLDDDNHMPPKGKPQLTKQEIQILKQWVEAGLSYSAKLSDYPAESSFAVVLDQLILDKAPKKSYDFNAADPALIEQLKSPFISIRPIAARSPALDVSFYVASSFEITQLKNLFDLRNQIVHLSLINMPLKDEDLELLRSFKQLEKLNLNGTGITNEGLSKLIGLDKLESLSLMGTNIGEPSDGFWNQWPVLQKLYISDTNIPYEKIDSIRKVYPQISIFATKPSEELSRLSPARIKNNQFIFEANDSLELIQRIKGAKVIFTLDGTEPDSTNGDIYINPIAVKTGFDLKTITSKEGWITSPSATYNVFAKGIKPSQVKLLTAANDKYPGQGGITVIDGEKAPVSNLTDPRWIGFREHKYVSTFTFDSPKPITQISIAYGLHVPAYVFPPTDITIMAGNSIADLKQISTKSIDRITRIDKDQVRNDVIHIPLTDKSYKHYKVIVQNLPRIPNWHAGKGDIGWLFIDEIFFYE